MIKIQNLNSDTRRREGKVITLGEKSGTIFDGTNLVNMNTARHRHITRRPVIFAINYGALKL